ncbi:uncharacterized protein LOC129601095 isoform X2 [Paramacrobiotus metropolitanus]|uniref:uncharacterized protein LOC129601095 isoform X2 n=1 Tax=Paramacrobiotus metropolitanus TaxID=2943436 RepID=UPI00244657F9|nr:uncharacterized protein LOC129601095 isoform X2 [Paramacrobiotus metropolitanus]
MEKVLVYVNLIFLSRFLVAAQVLPDDWQKFIDPEVLKEDNAELTSGNDLFEGDISGLDRITMASNREQAQDMVANITFLWPDGRVPYVISDKFGAMQNISAATGDKCITFTKRTDAGKDAPYIRFVRGMRCQSYVGRQGPDQLVELTTSCLKGIGGIQHEIMHALGFYHEMSRDDRDNFVTIMWNNIKDADKNQFLQYRGDKQGLPYDYASLMHYPYNAFAIDTKKPSVLPKKLGASIGQRNGLSELDVQRIRKAYCITAREFIKETPKVSVQEMMSTVTVGSTSTTTPFVFRRDFSLPDVVAILGDSRRELNTVLKYEIRPIWKKILGSNVADDFTLSMKSDIAFDPSAAPDGTSIHQIVYTVDGTATADVDLAVVAQQFHTLALKADIPHLWAVPNPDGSWHTTDMVRNQIAAAAAKSRSTSKPSTTSTAATTEEPQTITDDQSEPEEVTTPAPQTQRRTFTRISNRRRGGSRIITMTGPNTVFNGNNNFGIAGGLTDDELRMLPPSVQNVVRQSLSNAQTLIGPMDRSVSSMSGFGGIPPSFSGMPGAGSFGTTFGTGEDGVQSGVSPDGNTRYYRRDGVDPSTGARTSYSSFETHQSFQSGNMGGRGMFSPFR